MIPLAAKDKSDACQDLRTVSLRDKEDTACSRGAQLRRVQRVRWR
jgi:hypothetical protein